MNNCRYQRRRIQIVAPSGSGPNFFHSFAMGSGMIFNGNISIDGKLLKNFLQKISLIRSSVQYHFPGPPPIPDHTVYLKTSISKEYLIHFMVKERIKENGCQVPGLKTNYQNWPEPAVMAKAATCGDHQGIATAFDFILMDEPYSNLDENNRMIAMELIEEEAKKCGHCTGRSQETWIL